MKKKSQKLITNEGSEEPSQSDVIPKKWQQIHSFREVTDPFWYDFIPQITDANFPIEI